MDISFEKVDGHLYNAQLNTNQAQEIRDQLVGDAWIQEEPLWRGEERLERYHLINSTRPAPKKCLEYFWSQDWKNQLLDIAFANEKFGYLWNQPNRAKFDSVTRPYAKFVKDSPGYYTDFHCDSRHQIIFGMIYLISESNLNQTTIFYDDKYKLNPKSIPVGMGLGWLLVNNNDAWHEGGNLSNQDRYCLQYGLNFIF